MRGRTLVVMDERDEAVRSLHEALDVSRAIEYPPVQWRAHALLAELARRGPSGRAVRASRSRPRRVSRPRRPAGP